MCDVNLKQYSFNLETAFKCLVLKPISVGFDAVLQMSDDPSSLTWQLAEIIL